MKFQLSVSDATVSFTATAAIGIFAFSFVSKALD